MKLEDLGYSSKLEHYRQDNHLEDLEIGRVIEEHKERYKVRTATGEFDAEIIGNMRFTAKGREDFPAVGDWVAFMAFDENFAIIHKILPRFSTIKRKAVGHFGDVQIIATNIDYALIVQAVDRDFNINRLERYLTICNSSKVKPIIVLSKTDLLDQQQVSDLIENIKIRIQNIPVIAISNENQHGYEVLNSLFEQGKTYCLLGSSGVGKSTLLNNLSGKDIMKTGTISQSNNKGKHITSHRELIILENGSILIDNPGMREVGIVDSDDGLEITFDRIIELSKFCRFKDCSHTNEIGCSVLHALEQGEIDAISYANYLKMQKEKAHFEATAEEKRKKDKEFGKFINNYKKQIKKNYPTDFYQ
jgi:ribosome biogenesis GTPase